jgi:NAD+ synthase
MTDGLQLALAQLNPVVGDIAGNLVKLRETRRKASAAGAHLLMTPELYLCGYPPEDLVVKPSFQKALEDAVQLLAKDTADGGAAVLLGTPWVEDGILYNAVLLLDQGRVAAKIFKYNLPNYGPFDEKRIFTAGKLPEPVLFRGVKLGVIICEDMWTEKAAAHLAYKGVEILLVPNGSPYETGKQAEREEIARKRVAETHLPLVYLNQIGGQDELVFDGASFALDKTGACVSRIKAWQEDLAFVSIPHLQKTDAVVAGKTSEEETIYNALMLGLRDYVGKNGFPGVVLGLSGGIDSALVAALAVDALGADKVWCVMMPSPYTSKESHEDAAALAKNLKCRYDTIPITEGMRAFDATLKGIFTGKAADTTEENIQARCRGILLMALSNKFGQMVLSTGNKSEMSVGYSTLYGDLCGGFAVLKDVYKTQAYKIARWRNIHKPATALGQVGTIIPERIFTKAPTAELRPNQKDQDSLPPYEVLDDILECMIEKDLGVHEIAARGHDASTVKRIWLMLDKAEYKRRQAPPGVKITRRFLGKDRRYPITNRYRET